MFSKTLFSTVNVLLAALEITALPTNRTDDLVNAAIAAGTFQNPSNLVRPRFRYWIPDASIDHDVLAEDIKAFGALGAGGLECIGYYLYGGTGNYGLPTYAPVDWSVYGWGTPAWQSLFTSFAKAIQENGMIMDFAFGPNQGQGVPAVEGSDGLMWDLASFNVSIPAGGSFHGVLPGWGTGPIVSVTTGEVTSVKSYNTSTGNFVELHTLAQSTLQDVTNQISPSGTLSLQFPSTGNFYDLVVVYLIHSNYRAEASPETLGGPQTSPQNFIQNGSFAVDHYSVLGAQTVMDFWERYILIDGTKELLQEVGNYGWEDSYEIASKVYWTKDLPDIFLSSMGYSINKYVPLLLHENGDSTSDTKTWWVTDEADAGQSHVSDYRQTLTECYSTYLEALTNWMNSLGFQFSVQVGYNLPLDMMADNTFVNAPECEALGFNNLVDGYRQYVGPANLAGKRIISSELGVEGKGAYASVLPELLFSVKRSLAAGINQFVFHGAPYSGQYPNTTWPGFTTFAYLFSEMHGRHLPAWEFYSDTINWVARMQYIFQSGVPRLDVAIWDKQTAFTSITTSYYPEDLVETGYSYDYLSPDNFDLPDAYVQDGVLAPNGPAYKALVIRSNDTLTEFGVARLAEFAHGGLPIIFFGGVPSQFAFGFNASSSAAVSETLDGLRSLPNVHVVSDESLASTLASLSITPLTRISSNGTWYSYWRRDDIADADYVYLYNDAPYPSNAEPGVNGGYSEGVVEFASTGIPYYYDAWTGLQTPVLNYTRSTSTTTISFQLAGNQSTVIAFLSKPLNSDYPSEHMTSCSKGILGTAYDAAKGIIVKVGSGEPSPATFETSDGAIHTASSSSATPFTLSNWTLIVEHWDPPSDLYNITPIAVKSNTTHFLPDLVSWQELPGLQDVSGLGYYNTSFTWPPSKDADGAFIDFGNIFSTVRVSINGDVLPPLDLTWARADISPYLRNGVNEVQAVVSTTLQNRLRPIWTDLRTVGSAPQSLAGSPQDYGLLNPVVVTPYTEFTVG